MADLEFWKGRVRIPDSRKGQLKKYISFYGPKDIFDNFFITNLSKIGNNLVNQPNLSLL